MNVRKEELVAGALLADPDAALQCFHQKRWAELAALVRFVRRDVPVELAQTGPALYRTLRGQVTRFFLRGGNALYLEKLQVLAYGEVASKKKGRFEAGSSVQIQTDGILCNSIYLLVLVK